jgi:glycosyltransferase involved in cell wall biosynthesis
LKIGIVLPQNHKPSNGGGFSYVESLVKEICERKTDFDIQFISFHFQPKKYYQFNSSSVNVTYFSLGQALIKSPILAFTLLMERLAYKLNFFSWHSFFDKRVQFHSDTILKKEGFKLLYYPFPERLIGVDVPFFYTVWDLGHRNIGFFPDIASYPDFDRREARYSQAMKRAARVFVESKAGANDVSFYYQVKSNKIVVVPMFGNSLIKEHYTELEKQKFIGDNNIKKEKYLFYPAQFWPHKNHINLLKALYLVRKQGHDLCLLFTGQDKGNKNLIENTAKELAIDNAIQYLGFVDNKYIRLLYENAFALVMPTFLGPTNMPLVEAMELGCPVICTDLEGHREQASDAALYINPQRPEMIAEKIIFLLTTDGERARMISKGKTQIQQTNATVTSAVDKLFAEIEDFKNVLSAW